MSRLKACCLSIYQPVYTSKSNQMRHELFPMQHNIPIQTPLNFTPPNILQSSQIIYIYNLRTMFCSMVSSHHCFSVGHWDRWKSTIFLLVKPFVGWKISTWLLWKKLLCLLVQHFFGGSEVLKHDFLVFKASCSIHFCSHFYQLHPNSPFLLVDSIHSPFLWLNSLWLKFPFLFLEFHKNSWWKSPFCCLESCEKSP